MDDIRLLYIDLFCGAGGTSTGVEKANYKGRKCAKVIACVNHDANAIASHAANHPEAQHYTEDMRTLDLCPLKEHTAEMRQMYPMAKIVLWASLECTNYGIVDIKMRMLKIIELKRIMGFPENYTLIGTQADQKKFIGNAVEVNIARVLCEALVEEIVDELLKVA